jgi:Ankyrin repeat
MVNDIGRRVESFTGSSAQPYRSQVAPPHVEQAARTGKLNVVQQYLDAGGSVNARTVYQSQLLHVAARHGQLEILELLLAAPGIDIMALDYVSQGHHCIVLEADAIDSEVPRPAAAVCAMSLCCA